MEAFSELIFKSKIDYQVFKNYFLVNKNEYCVFNALKLNDTKYLISAFGLFKFFEDFKIYFKETYQDNYKICYTLDAQASEQLVEYFEFYTINKDKDKTKLEIINIQEFIVVKEIFNFLENFQEYFETIDNYFSSTDLVNRIAYSGFLILDTNNNNTSKNIIKLNDQPIPLGVDVISINSNLAALSYQRFSKFLNFRGVNIM